MKTLIDHVEEVYLINLQRCNTDNQRVVKEINNTDPYRLLELISVILERMQQDTQPTKDVPVNDSIHQLTILGLRQGEYIDYLLDCINCSTSIKMDTQTEFEARNEH
tara:strand:- start:231 stop:551 length:321 start_codon:yes stop_codon:yes gene_type:complete